MKKILFLLVFLFLNAFIYAQETSESANSQSVVMDPLCTLCAVENPENAVDGDEETYSAINLGLAIDGSSITQLLKFPSSACSGEKLVLGINNDGLVELPEILVGLSITTFLNGVSNDDEQPVNISSVIIDLLNDRSLVTVFPENKFDEIAIKLTSGIAGGLTSINLYFAKKVLIFPEVSGATSVCVEDEVNLLLNNPESRFKYFWYANESGGSPIDSGITFSFVPTSSASIFLSRCRDSTGNRLEIPISILERPSAPDFAGDLEYCEGDHAAFIASGSNLGASYIWNFNGQETIGPVYNSPKLNLDSKIFLLSSIGGCRSKDTVLVPLVISKKMDAPVVQCEALSPTSVKFLWTGNSSADGYLVGINGGSVDKTPTKQGNGTSPWEFVVSNLKLDEVIFANVKAVDDSPCKFGETSQVVSCQVTKCDTPVFEAPLIVKVCLNEQGEIALEGNDLDRYEFSFDGQPYTTNPVFNFTPTTSTEISVKVRYPNALDCPTKEVKVLIEVLPIPEVAFSASSNFVTVPGGEVKFTNETLGAVDFSWDFGDGQTSTFINPSVRFMKEMNYDISLTVDNSFGCRSVLIKRSLMIGQLKGSIFIPNAFTPNNDGKNDYFEIVGKRISDFSITIFNENGKFLFKSLILENQWDGSFNNQPQPEGIYYFLVNAKLDDGEDLLKKGILNLIR
jgi:gliding motility-associated-like protein